MLDPTCRKCDRILAPLAGYQVRREVLGTPTRTLTLAATTPISWRIDSFLARFRDMVLFNRFVHEVPSHRTVELE